METVGMTPEQEDALERMFEFFLEHHATLGPALVEAANDYREGAAKELQIFIAWLHMEGRPLPRAVAEFEMEAKVRIANGEEPRFALKLARADGGRMKDREHRDDRSFRRAVEVLAAHVERGLPLNDEADENAFQHHEGAAAMKKAWDKHSSWLGQLDYDTAVRLVGAAAEARKHVDRMGD